MSTTAVLLCCYSKPSERAAVCFVPPAVAVCVHHAYPVYCGVHCTCYNNMYPDSLDRNYTQFWDSMYHIITSIFELYTYLSSSPGDAHHSLFLGACPPFVIFVGLPFPVFKACPAFGLFSCNFFSNRIIRSTRTRFLLACLCDIILHKIPSVGKKKVPPSPEMQGPFVY